MHCFEDVLLVPTEDVALELSAGGMVAWMEFWLNPRRLRGSDFLMRWSQGRWSEDLLVKAVNATGEFFAVPYGPSSTAPSDDVREFELYFERLEAAGLGRLKRPDLLIFRESERSVVDECISEVGGISELPFTAEEADPICRLLGRATVAIECENSLWKCRSMPDFGATLKPQRRLAGRPGLKKSAVLPTVIIKEEDRAPLYAWQDAHGVAIHVWHVFFDLAFGLSLPEAGRLIRDGLVEPTEHIFQAPGGATTAKRIWKFPYQYAYELAETVQDPTLIGTYIQDKNGHILPYVRFDGGQIALRPAAMQVLHELTAPRP